MTDRPIKIIGAGIAGLTAALAFARLGYSVEIFDQAPKLSEVGAGLQMSPNASRILIALGLGDALENVISRPDEIALLSGHTLRKIAHVPCGDFATRRWGAPYGALHRADLQALLLEAVENDPKCQLKLASRFELSALQDLVRADTTRPAPLLIGADGVWSQTRELIPGAASPKFSGQVAWRFKLEAKSVRSLLNPANVTALLAPRTHLVAYPIERGASFNMVAITQGSDPGPTWQAQEKPSDRRQLLNAFRDWHPSLLTFLRDAPEMTWWPLFGMEDGRWYDGAHSIVIGDAAHAMTPFAAQGAAMAIEDAYELAHAFAQTSGGTEDAHKQALLGYETHRRARIAQARKRAAFNQFAYHASGPIRLGRDIVLRFKSPESLARDLDWLYGYRATGT